MKNVIVIKIHITHKLLLGRCDNERELINQFDIDKQYLIVDTLTAVKNKKLIRWLLKKLSSRSI